MFPVSPRASFLLLALASTTPAGAAVGDSDGARFQRDLQAVLECRASADTGHRVVSTLRAARYGDPGDRPLHLRDWHFEQSGDSGDAGTTVIDMPVPLIVQGVPTQRVFADALGFSIPLAAADRERIVAGHGLRLQSSTLRAPFQVWSARPVGGSVPAPSISVSSDGEGYRLRCAGPSAVTQATPPPQQLPRADARDLIAALQCHADEAALGRVGRLLQQVIEQPQSEWPADVRAVSAPRHAINGTVLPVFQIELEAPLRVQGIATDRLLAVPEGLIAADLGRTAVATVLRGAGLEAVDAQAGAQVWQREASRSPLPSGSVRIRERVVARTDDGSVLSGCSSSQMRTAAGDP